MIISGVIPPLLSELKHYLQIKRTNYGNESGSVWTPMWFIGVFDNQVNREVSVLKVWKANF